MIQRKSLNATREPMRSTTSSTIHHTAPSSVPRRSSPSSSRPFSGDCEPTALSSPSAIPGPAVVSSPTFVPDPSVVPRSQCRSRTLSSLLSSQAPVLSLEAFKGPQGYQMYTLIQ
ncbi:unnamed protein product [Arctogadus glacialis]